MTSYIVPLLAVVALLRGLGRIQLWLSNTTPSRKNAP